MTHSPHLNRRLLIVSQGVPHEAQGASAVIFFHYIERLKRAGFQILHWLLTQPPDDTSEKVAAYADKVVEPGRFELLHSHANRWVAARGISFEPNRLAAENELRLARDFQPDAQFLIDLVPAWLAQSIPARAKVCWLGDLNFQTQHYHAIYAAREKWSRAIKLPKTWLRCRSWRHIYRDVLQDMDSVIVSSISGEEQMRRIGIRAKYHAYPWPAHDAPRDVALPDRPTFLFLGNLQGLGSRSALHFMFERLYPQLRKSWGANGFEILVAGRTALPAWAQRPLQGRPEFKFLGFVPDIHRLMAGCHAVLAPIDVPVGNRTRILTAMYNRSLVIAHPHTALGNPDLVDGETCFLAADAVRFAGCMRIAVERPTHVCGMIDRAEAAVGRSFAPDVAAQVVVEAINSGLIESTLPFRQREAA